MASVYRRAAPTTDQGSLRIPVMLRAMKRGSYTAIMNLTPPPLWQEWLFENPWPLVIVLIVLAVVLRLMATRSRRPRGYRFNYAALGALLAALGVYLLTVFVETDRERLVDRTRQLVAATAPLDTAAIDALIARGAVVTGPAGETWVLYDDIRPELERAVGRHGIARHALRSLAADVVSSVRGRSLLSLSTTTDDLGLPIRTQWLITWRKEGDGTWRVIELQWLEFQGQPPRNLMWR